MKILAITPYYPPHHIGGYELRCKDVMDGLIKRGHQVVMVTTRCTSTSCNLHPGENNIHRNLHERRMNAPVPQQIFMDRSDLRYIDQIVKDFFPDLIYLWHIQNLSNAILPYFSTWDVPIVFDEGGTDITHLSRVQKRGLYFYTNGKDTVIKKQAKWVISHLAKIASNNLIQPEWDWPARMRMIFNSHSGQQAALHHDAPVSNASVIFPGIDLSKYIYQPRERVSQPIKIVVPGRIKEQKSQLDVVHLAEILAGRNLPAQITLAGTIQSTPYYADIKNSIKQHHLESEITYAGMKSINGMCELYREASFCFFPSQQKYGFSRIPLEAMACGCVVITYGNEGTNEVIKHEATGIIVPEWDIDASAQWIERLTRDADEYREISANARKLVVDNFSLDKYVASVEELLDASVSTLLINHATTIAK